MIGIVFLERSLIAEPYMIAEETAVTGVVCENASKYGPTQKGTHAIVYIEKSISSVGVTYRTKRDPGKF